MINLNYFNNKKKNRNKKQINFKKTLMIPLKIKSKFKINFKKSYRQLIQIIKIS